MPLSSFTPRVRAWFEQAFAEPTPAQAQAWPAIARGEHVLLSAPTGSGKTLAAFLWALDRLSTASTTPDDIPANATSPVAATVENAPGHVRVLYISPLKALAYDIERNLRTPLRGIGAEDVRVGIRTGDTPQRERAAMLRNPPDILITTPESLYLMLTSRAREMLSGVEAVIVDEIHAVAATKRGSHLALTLERLEAHVRATPRDTLPEGTPSSALGSAHAEPARGDRPLPRWAATGGHDHRRRRAKATRSSHRGARRVDGRTRRTDRALAKRRPAADPLDPLAGGESTRNSIWPAIYPELLKLVREHSSTIVFVNNRRSAERVALRLNELAARGRTRSTPRPRAASTRPPGTPSHDIARAHHGSLAREERTKVEELLKAGELPCLVATSSLELGIDMGAVDLVLQIESPKSVARGLQRIGRAGHGVGEVSRGGSFRSSGAICSSAPSSLVACMKA